MKQYDYLIVGAGLYGAVFAHEAKKAGKKFGRPALNWDWDLFDATAQRWADGEISLEEACDIMNSARSSWYKYVKERGFVRTRKRKNKED